MNRNDEYIKLMDELEEIPMQLEYSRQRAEARMKFEKKRRLFVVPCSSVALFLIAFTIFVNCFPTFAYACGRIPLIKELAQLVAFSPSLSAAVENEYVQPIEQEQSSNGITARVEYVIVDQKQLLVFYTLDSKEYQAMNASVEIKEEDGTALSGYSISNSDFGKPNGEIKFVTIDFTENDMPLNMLFTLYVRDTGSFWKEEVVAPKDSNVMDDMTEEEDEQLQVYTDTEYISKFTFHLEFNPYYTAQGIDIQLKETFQLDEQTLILDHAEIYPTHIRITFSDIPENTAWLKGLSFYLMNEKGEKFESISNGITSTGSEGSPMMESHRLESTFFSNSEELYLHITGVEWLDKDMEKIKLDLLNVSAEFLPQGVIFERTERTGNNWLLTFSGKRYKENTSYQIFNSNYYDEEGNKYNINSWTTDTSWGGTDSIESEDKFITQIPLKKYPYDIVYMSPLFSREVQLDEPIVIKIK